MTIEKKTLREVSPKTRQIFQKANEAAHNDPKYGLMIVYDLVKAEPGFVEARKLLRTLQHKNTDKLGFLANTIAQVKSTGKVTKGLAVLRKNPMEAMQLAEEALNMKLNNPQALTLLADSSTALGASFIAAEAYETLLNYHPKDVVVMARYADSLEKSGESSEVLRLRQQICDLLPGNMEAQQKLREAAALATLSESSWKDNGDNASFRDKVKDVEAAKLLEQQDRIARNADDVAEVIEQYEAEVNDGNESIDLRRKLAEYYQRANRHEDAIDAYRWIANKTGRLDPSIDKSIQKSEIAILEANAEAAPEQAEDIAIQILQLRLDRAYARVDAYPNDLQLRFELGEVYWEVEDIDSALEQFQLAKRNPQRRLEAMVFIARIFHIKHQYDLSEQQFQDALKEMLIMDPMKMETLYYYGTLLEEEGKLDKARECFVQIYQSNVRFKDVKQRVEGTPSN